MRPCPLSKQLIASHQFFFFLYLLLPFFFHLPSQVITHLFFLFLRHLFSSVFFLFFLSKLILYMAHHLVVFSFDLLFLIFDDRISKRGHNCFDFLFSLTLLFFSFTLQLILKSCILLLSLDILNSLFFSLLS